MAVDRKTGKISHYHFYDLPKILKQGDILVRNNTKVIPARLFGRKPTGGKVEVLLNKKVSAADEQEIWECLTMPGLKIGQKVTFPDSQLEAVCVSTDGYARMMKFNKSGEEFLKQIEKIGEIPLPPYLDPSQRSDDIFEKYQTIFAEEKGSVAAPTAGLHFTPELEDQLAKSGIEVVEITLHVGAGTFLPVKTENIEEHKMHSEIFSLSKSAAAKLNLAKTRDQRIISVGTTTTRVLETCAYFDEKTSTYQLSEQSGSTDIFIYPGYKYKFIDGLITNFHLPKYTLLMLVSAFVSRPNTNDEFVNFEQSLIGKAYSEAIAKEYRFYSFGDGMVIF